MRKGKGPRASQGARVVSSVAFQVLGKPKPQGSKKHGVNRKTGKSWMGEQVKGLDTWRRHVRKAATEAATAPFDGPVRMEVTFVFERGKGHYRTGRFSSLLRDDAPRYPVARSGLGDLDKLIRSIGDAITGPVLVDDALIVSLASTKVYGEPERCEVIVREMA